MLEKASVLIEMGLNAQEMGNDAGEGMSSNGISLNQSLV